MQGGEIVRLGHTRVLVQEGVGREQDRGLHLGQQVGDLLGVQGRGVFKRLHPLQQRQDDPARQTQGVEGRQRVEHHPLGLQVDVGRDLAGVGDQIALAQHHALGRAEAARGKKDHARRIGIGLHAEATRRHAGAEAVQLVGQADGLAHVVQPDDLGDFAQGRHQVVQLGLGDEALGRQDLGDARRLQRRLQIGLARGEVQHDRHAAEGVQAEEGHDHARAGRQQDADALARRRHGGDLAAQHEGGADQAGVGQGMTILVFQDLLVAIAGARIDQRVEQGFVIDLGVQGSPQARPPSESSETALSVTRGRNLVT
ncbi:hypothetical protein D3C86_1167030 [compost metagenome]